MASIGDSSFKLVNDGLSRTRFKIELLGDSNVGKTSILLRYVDDTFSGFEKFQNLGERTKNVKVNGKEFTLEIWDTSHQQYEQMYKTFSPHLFREPDAAILVYSVVNEESFRNLCDYWLDRIVRYRPHDRNMPILLVGNMKDLWDSSYEHVSFDTVQEYADTHDLMHPLECSAKTGVNIHRIFHLVASELYKRCMKSEVDTDGNERKPVQNQNLQFCRCS